jgi:hypothetical protein
VKNTSAYANGCGTDRQDERKVDKNFKKSARGDYALPTSFGENSYSKNPFCDATILFVTQQSLSPLVLSVFAKQFIA